MASIYRKKGNDIWYYCITYGGKKYQGTTKTTDKQSAKLIAEAKQTDIAREKNDLPVLKKTVVNFTTAWDRYIKADSSSSSNIKNKKYLSIHFLSVFKNKDIKDITVSDIENYRLQRKVETENLPKNTDKKESQISFRTVNREISILHHFFEYCIKNGMVDKNPAAGHKKLREGKRDIYLSKEEQERLIAVASPHVKLFIGFSTLTGFRKSDVLGLKWDDVNLEDKVIRVWINKTREWKIYPLSTAATNVLKNIKKDCEYVFSYKGKRLNDIKRSFKTSVRRAGLSGKEGLTPHACRHIFVTRLTEAGVESKFIRDAAGHMSEKMSERYKHLSPNALRAKLDEAFSGDKKV
ncbi:MAG: site-specific integrase [Candidatus Acidulodesulfobacterium ferriphilum]|jgi:integrase|uniref:Site-specific integrase n=1 Tax=Candidatus Acidulodesulfobacterium ferriphilum TaxID=2597223 RepID=A0A519B9P1_9DELT|nr:MAG: site-specific integrase [Candidatus Acidulodesulfobacterium ferriphilum]